MGVLGELPPDEARADDVDGPLLRLFDGDGECGGDGGVGEVLADVLRGEGRERQEPDFAGE
jgi:hypothetical protein